jgi:hypothetical protein
MTCWICQEHAQCPFPICAEQEKTEKIKIEQLEMGFDDDRTQGKTSGLAPE